MAAKIGGGGGSKFDLGQNSDMNDLRSWTSCSCFLIIFMVVTRPLATVLDQARPMPPAKAPPPN